MMILKNIGVMVVWLQLIEHSKARLGETGKVALRVTAGSQAFLIAVVP